ncbi:MAG: DUF6893 family small protein [Solirubrobacteraceae bacterium]
MSKTGVAALALSLGIGGAVASQWPEVARYLKVRKM